MSSFAHAAGAAALALLLAPAAGRAELTPSKLKFVSLDASFESAVSAGDETSLFLEEFTLKKPGCVLVRYSGELIGSDFSGDSQVSADFTVSIGDVEVETHPEAHEATTSILPQIVAFSASRCGVPAGPTAVAVTVRASEDDHVGIVFRTLEVWTERPILVDTGALPPARLKAERPDNFLQAKRSFLASSDETVTARIDPTPFYAERFVLKKGPSCLLVRVSAEVRGEDVDANDSVVANVRVAIGGIVPPHPNLLDLTSSEQPQIVTFSAFRCGLDPGEYDVVVEAESADDDDPIEIRSRAIEVFTATGRPASDDLVRMNPRRAFLASAADEVVAGGSRDLFREPLVLTAPTGCVTLHFSGEMSRTASGKGGSPTAVASFELAVDDTLAAAPIFHEVPTIAPRLVSFDGHACGLPAGAHEVSVRVRSESLDQVTVRVRTLEVRTESGRVAPDTIGSGPAAR